MITLEALRAFSFRRTIRASAREWETRPDLCTGSSLGASRLARRQFPTPQFPTPKRPGVWTLGTSAARCCPAAGSAVLRTAREAERTFENAVWELGVVELGIDALPPFRHRSGLPRRQAERGRIGGSSCWHAGCKTLNIRSPVARVRHGLPPSSAPRRAPRTALRLWAPFPSPHRRVAGPGVHHAGRRDVCPGGHGSRSHGGDELLQEAGAGAPQGRCSATAAG